jgi:hypothetical protein
VPAYRDIIQPAPLLNVFAAINPSPERVKGEVNSTFMGKVEGEVLYCVAQWISVLMKFEFDKLVQPLNNL